MGNKQAPVTSRQVSDAGTDGENVLSTKKKSRLKTKGLPGHRPAGRSKTRQVELKTGNSLMLYLKRIGAVPLLTREQEAELAQQMETGRIEILNALLSEPWARKQLCIPSVLMMRAAEDGSFMDCDEGPRCDLVIANSNSIRARASRWAVPVETVLPVVRRPSVPQGHLRSKVTMVNPVHVKGADRFAAIASACPEREFLAVRSWSGLRSGDSWSSDMWGRLAVSQGLDSLDAPAEFDFGNISNVEVIGPVADMGEHVYSRTRVLLVPSRWSEAFGRVVLEAQMCGIPVIAADVGGIRDALNGAGIVIACPDSIGTWVRALESLDDASAYRAARQRALTAASSYDCVNQVIKLRRLLAELLNSQRGVC